MKKKLATLAMTVALLTWTGAATAGTYQGTASHDGTRWIVVWNNVSPPCSSTALLNAVGSPIATVDGTDYHLMTLVANSYWFNNSNELQFLPSPAGSLTKITTQGQGSFQCDGHTFLLPGHTPPPAAIPTMSEWAMIFMGGLMALGAAVFLQRRRNITRPF